MFIEILYYLTIRPLEILFETIFFISYRFIGKPFATIIAPSIFVNILVLPLYKRADKLQAEQREREKAMEGMLSHIKKTFKGDERVMMTQAYYRICDYKPVYALRGASSLLLQIPFFISAYRFLSGLELIKGMPSILLNLPGAAGPSYLIKDLGAPDAMFSVHGIAINVLPILMTLINIVSGTIYSKGHLKKEKVQLYVTALVFLVLLYNSPAGLVMYWTFNNIFSLCKNAVQKIFESRKNAKSVNASQKNVKERDVQKSGSRKVTVTGNSSKVYDHLFIASALLMALMTGLYIPSNVLSSSASEFINSLDIFNPARYLVYSLSLGLGFFVLWIGIYYLFSAPKVRRIFAGFMAVICAWGVVDYLLSGSGLGTLSADLKYDNPPVFGSRLIVINLALMIFTAAVIFILYRFKPAIIQVLAMAGCAALICISAININNTTKGYDTYLSLYASSDAYNMMPRITLSKNERNVVVVVLDKAVGTLMPYILSERPDLMETYDGFTYYHDTISFGKYTNFGMPAVYGGYEYTPAEINKRDDELLVDKHDEALRVLPVLFSQNGYGVTVFDPPYAGYQLLPPDLSIYDDYPEINKYISQGKFNSFSDDVRDDTEKSRKRNFFYFGEMKTVPLIFQGLLYNNGNYNYEFKASQTKELLREMNLVQEVEEYGEQDQEDYLVAEGFNAHFTTWYSALDNMENYTDIADEDRGEFLMFYNCTPHDANICQLPDYKPAVSVDNRGLFDESLYTINGIKMNMDNFERVAYYHANMAGYLRLGEWLDYLKEQGVYDNTRIIIVSDHGTYEGWFDGFGFGEAPYATSLEWFVPILMYKDFDSHGFQMSDEFMTNADTPALATGGGVVEKAVNPFTGNPLNGHEKTEDQMKILASEELNVYANNGNKFNPGYWYTVSGSPYDVRNWSYLGFE